MSAVASERLGDALALQERLRAGDEAAFEAVFRAYYGRAYALAYRLLGCHQAADDTAQEAFLRLYRRPLPAGRQHNLLGWLLAVTANLAHNALRAQRRRQAREARAETAHVPNPAEVALSAAEAERVRAALAELPERQARLLLLRQAGLSYTECAEALGVAPGSIGTLLARAEQALRERLSGEE
jgi:RNA polymerase sigma-70 factor (ECF subfamily)